MRLERGAMSRRWGILSLALVGFIALVVALVPASAQAVPKSRDSAYKSFHELAGKRLGMVSGSLYGEALIKKEPGISLDDIETYRNIDDMVAALKSNQIEGFLTGEAPGGAIVSENSDLALMEDAVTDDNIGMCLKNNSKLTAKFNQCLDSLRMEGTVDALRNRSLESFEASVPKENKSDGLKINGVLRVAYSTIKPMSFISNKGYVVGYEAELVRLIANELGYSVVFINMPFKDVLDWVESGKADVGIGNITITEQRDQFVDFTNPDYMGNVVVVTHAAKDHATSDVIADVIRSFRKTFLVENRWAIIVSGLLVTLTISLCAGSLGSPLAIVLVWRRYCGGKLTARLIDVFEGFVGGVPILVILMVLYYVVFGRAHLPGEVVAIIAFTLSFAGRAAALLWSAVEDVPKSQEEGGLALGYTEEAVFFKIVLPQAAHKVMLRFANLFVAVVKETAAVGYIAVQDLTRASDYIRARTMEAFFPLVATAIIYFLICNALAWALKKVAVRHLSKDRSRIVKGVLK